MISDGVPFEVISVDLNGKDAEGKALCIINLKKVKSIQAMKEEAAL